jgi:hypothetical protein
MSQGQESGLQQQQPLFEFPLPCSAGMTDFFPLANTARAGRACVSRKQKTRGNMIAQRHIVLAETGIYTKELNIFITLLIITVHHIKLVGNIVSEN